jgi:Na+(H+)/acetate symporter ActP
MQLLAEFHWLLGGLAGCLMLIAELLRNSSRYTMADQLA